MDKTDLLVRTGLGRTLDQTLEKIPLNRRLTYRVGRNHDQEIRIANDMISREHCVFAYVDEAWTLEDKKSLNKTSVNGEDLNPYQRRPLRHKDVVRFGIALEKPCREFKFCLNLQDAEEIYSCEGQKRKREINTGRQDSDFEVEILSDDDDAKQEERIASCSAEIHSKKKTRLSTHDDTCRNPSLKRPNNDLQGVDAIAKSGSSETVMSSSIASKRKNSDGNKFEISSVHLTRCPTLLASPSNSPMAASGDVKALNEEIVIISDDDDFPENAATKSPEKVTSSPVSETPSDSSNTVALHPIKDEQHMPAETPHQIPERISFRGSRSSPPILAPPNVINEHNSEELLLILEHAKPNTSLAESKNVVVSEADSSLSPLSDNLFERKTPPDYEELLNDADNDEDDDDFNFTQGVDDDDDDDCIIISDEESTFVGNVSQSQRDMEFLGKIKNEVPYDNSDYIEDDVHDAVTFEEDEETTVHSSDNPNKKQDDIQSDLGDDDVFSEDAQELVDLDDHDSPHNYPQVTAVTNTAKLVFNIKDLPKGKSLQTVSSTMEKDDTVTDEPVESIKEALLPIADVNNAETVNKPNSECKSPYATEDGEVECTRILQQSKTAKSPNLEDEAKLKKKLIRAKNRKNLELLAKKRSLKKLEEKTSDNSSDSGSESSESNTSDFYSCPDRDCHFKTINERYFENHCKQHRERRENEEKAFKEQNAKGVRQKHQSLEVPSSSLIGNVFDSIKIPKLSKDNICSYPKVIEPHNLKTSREFHSLAQRENWKRVNPESNSKEEKSQKRDTEDPSFIDKAQLKKKMDRTRKKIPNAQDIKRVRQEHHQRKELLKSGIKKKAERGPLGDPISSARSSATIGTRSKIAQKSFAPVSLGHRRPDPYDVSATFKEFSKKTSFTIPKKSSSLSVVSNPKKTNATSGSLSESASHAVPPTPPTKSICKSTTNKTNISEKIQNNNNWNQLQKMAPFYNTPTSEGPPTNVKRHISIVPDSTSGIHQPGNLLLSEVTFSQAKSLYLTLKWNAIWLKEQKSKTKKDPPLFGADWEQHRLNCQNDVRVYLQDDYNTFDDYHLAMEYAIMSEIWSELFHSHQEKMKQSFNSDSFLWPGLDNMYIYEETSATLTEPIEVLRFRCKPFNISSLLLVGLISVRDIKKIPSEDNLILINPFVSSKNGASYEYLCFAIVRFSKSRTVRDGIEKIKAEKDSCPLLQELIQIKDDDSKCVCWISVEVNRKNFDVTKNLKVSSNLLKLDRFANQLAGVSDLEKKNSRHELLKVNVGYASDQNLKKAIETFSSDSNHDKKKLNEQQKVVNSFEVMSTSGIKQECPPITLVQGIPGSGKTHLTLKLIEMILQTIKDKKTKEGSTLLLVPRKFSVKDIFHRGSTNIGKNCKNVVYLEKDQSIDCHYFLENLLHQNFKVAPKNKVNAKKLSLEKLRQKCKELDKFGDSQSQKHENQAAIVKQINYLKSELKALKSEAYVPSEAEKHDMTGLVLEKAYFIYVVVDGENEKDFIKFARCQGMFDGKFCKHRKGVRVTNVIVDDAHAISEPNLMAVLGAVSWEHLILIGDVNQIPPLVKSLSLKSQPGLLTRYSLFSRMMNKRRNEDPIRLHRLLSRPRFHHPVLGQMQHRVLNISGNDSIEIKEKKLSSFHLFRVPDDLAILSLKQHPWSDVWEKSPPVYQGIICAVAILLSEVILPANKVNIVVTNKNLLILLKQQTKIRTNCSSVELPRGVQGQESDISIIVLCPDSSFSSRPCFFESTAEKNVAFTRARRAVYVIGRQPEIETSHDVRDLQSFAIGEFDESSKRPIYTSILPMGKSLKDVQDLLRAVIDNRDKLTAWSGGFYSAMSPSYNVVAPLPYYRNQPSASASMAPVIRESNRDPRIRMQQIQSGGQQ